MMAYASRHVFGILVLALTLLSPSAAADELLGCSSPTNPGGLTCPRDSAGAISCNAAGTTSIGIGVTSLNTTLLPSPLTWTLGVSSVPSSNSASSSPASVSRSYILGAPKGFNVSTTPFDVCALFLSELTPRLGEMDITGDGNGMGKGQKAGLMCEDVLEKRCVEELVDQVWKVANVSGSGTDQCDRMARSVEAVSPPESCAERFGESWGRISVAAFRYLTAPPPPASDTPCYPTTESEYQLTTVVKFQHRGSGFGAGVTPLFTVIMGKEDYSGNLPKNASGKVPGGWNRDGTKKLEVHLSCLAPVRDEATVKAGEAKAAEEAAKRAKGPESAAVRRSVPVGIAGIVVVMMAVMVGL